LFVRTGPDLPNAAWIFRLLLVSLLIFCFKFPFQVANLSVCAAFRLVCRNFLLPVVSSPFLCTCMLREV
jgi:hypothetical protein